MDGSLSVVIRIINVKNVGVDKAKNHPPVCANRYRPKAFEFAFERMQTEARNIHIGHHPGRIEPHEDIAEPAGVLGENAARVVVFVKAL